MAEAKTDGRIALVGIPIDGNSSFLRGAARAPTAIRQELRCPSGSLCTEAGVDLEEDPGWFDAGDLDVGEAFDDLDAAATRLLEEGHRILALGGDHSISYPLVRARARRGGPPTVVQLDAHPDLYEELDGSRTSHACPFARILEDGCVARLVQVGIRASTPLLREQAARYGVETFAPATPTGDLLASLAGPFYVSVDLDVLDPAFAPGVSHREPGGLSTRELLSFLQALPRTVVGADLVELNPLRDLDGLTARVAAKVTKELLGLMLESR